MWTKLKQARFDLLWTKAMPIKTKLSEGVLQAIMQLQAVFSCSW